MDAAASGAFMSGAANMGNAIEGGWGNRTDTRGIANQNTDVTIEELLNQVASMVQSSQTQETGSVRQMSTADIQQMQTLIGQLTGQLTGAAPASVDFAAARDAAVQQTLEAGMGDVIAQGSNARAYGGTPQATAAERLSSRAAVEGAAAETSSRLQFESQLQTAIANLNSILKGATTDTSNISTSDVSQSQQSQTETDRTEKTEVAQNFMNTSDPTGRYERFWDSYLGSKKKGLSIF